MIWRSQVPMFVCEAGVTRTSVTGAQAETIVFAICVGRPVGGHVPLGYADTRAEATRALKRFRAALEGLNRDP